MLFRRRHKPRFSHRIGNMIWPRSGWGRALLYGWRRVSRLSASPHIIALGFCAGVFASLTPFLGFHFVIAALIAWLVGGSILASAFGTMAGNPLTWPVVWLGAFNIGNWVLGWDAPADKLPLEPSVSMFMEHPIEHFATIMLPMALGCIPIGLAIAAVCYWPVRGSVAAYQSARRDRISGRGIMHPVENAEEQVEL